MALQTSSNIQSITESAWIYRQYYEYIKYDKATQYFFAEYEYMNIVSYLFKIKILVQFDKASATQSQHKSAVQTGYGLSVDKMCFISLLDCFIWRLQRFDGVKVQYRVFH